MARIVVIPSWFPNKVQPLFGSFVLEQVRALASTYQDVEWHVIAPDAPQEWLSLRRPFASFASFVRSWRHAGAGAVETDGHVIIHRVQALHGSPRLGLLGYAPYKRIVARSLKQIEERFGAVDLLHVHGCYPAGLVVASLRPSCPWVLTEHQGPFPFAELRCPDGSLWPELREVFRAASAVVAVSRPHALDIERFTSVVATTISNMCDERVFKPRLVRPSGPFTFLTVASLSAGKGVDVLLLAIAEFRSRGQVARFRIVGAGPLDDQLRAQSQALGLGGIVEWCGSMPREELPELFRSADAFVLPSRYESFGIAYIEALASGIPIIATRCGGPEDIVRPGNGVLVPIDNHHALANALGAMVVAAYDPESIRRDFLGRFATGPVCRNIMALYESVG